MALDLFVGVTTWKGELFLPHCLESIQTKAGLDVFLDSRETTDDDGKGLPMAFSSLGRGPFSTISFGTRCDCRQSTLPTRSR